MKSNWKASGRLRLHVLFVFFILRLVVVLVPASIVGAIVLEWIGIPRSVQPSIGMGLGSLAVMACFDFIENGKFSRGVKRGNRMSGKLVNHANDLTGSIPIELDHPSIFHRLKRNTQQILNALCLVFKFTRRPDVIPMGGDPCNESANQNGDDRISADGHDD